MSDLEFLALHGLAVKKAGSAAAVADILGGEEAEVDAALEAAVGPGRAAGAKGMFMVAPPGAPGSTSATPRSFADFRAEPRRDRGLRALRAHQPRAARALHRLADDARRGGERVAQRPLRRRLRRRHHRPARRPARARREGARRLRRSSSRGWASTGAGSTSAYDKVLAGEHDCVSGARIDSYHTVWFELHEDLCACSAANARRRRESTVRVDREALRSLPIRGRDSAYLPSREVVGSKGASIALDAQPRPAGAARVRACRSRSAAATTPPAASSTTRPGRRCSPAIAGLERDSRPPARRSRAAAAGLGALGRGGEHARDDGHDPQPRHHRRGRGRRWRELSGDPGFARSTHVRFVHEFGQTVLGADLDGPAPDATADAGPRRGRRRHRRGGPDRPARAAARRRSTRLRLLVVAPRHGLPPPLGHPRGRRHRGGRAGDGVRQPRRATPAPACSSPATRSAATPEPYGEWLPGRAGRGRRQRHATTRCRCRPCASRCRRSTTSCSRPPRCSSARTATSRTSSSPSSAAGCTCCRRARPSARPLAAVRTAVDFAAEGAIDRAEALRRVSAEQLASVLAPRLAEEVDRRRRGARARHRRLPGRRRRAASWPTPTRPRRRDGRRRARPADHEPRGRRRA